MAVELKNIPLKGLFPLPDELADAPTQARAAFWRLIGIEARHLKKKEILSGIDRWGNKFQPVKRKWGNPTPLIPHDEASRTFHLLTLNWTAQGATLYWRADSGRESWKTILGYHAYKHGPRNLPVRDEFGLSPRSISILAGRVQTIWETINPRKPRPRSRPLVRLAVREDRRQMKEANRLTREAMAEAAEIMTALLALSLGKFFLWDPGEPIE